MSKKITSILLVLCMMMSCIAVGSFVTSAATVDDSSTGAGSQEPQATVQGSAILHCFDWSYNNIKNNLAAIKAAGYTAVQTSPVQPPKDYSASYTDNSGQWWKLYQPLGISIADGNTWLGTKAELKSLCAEAEKYGIKVIVDIVANHLADNGKNKNGLDNVYSGVESTLRQSKYWHDYNGGADDNSRYATTHGHIGLPDLNTGDSYIMNRYKDLLVELVGLGVDGFRFDAAKHIELPNDPEGASNFWPTVLNGAKNATSNELYFYGEILNSAAVSTKNYATYMSYTDNYASDKALKSANNGDASGLADSAYYKWDGEAKYSVLWVESHDTYMGNSGSAGIQNTANISDSTIVKTWAIVASRADASALFFARPNNTIGAASSNNTWKSTEVTEINKFKNFFDGESEYLSSSGKVAYNERGTSGVVISKLDGGGQVSLAAHKMAAGTYKDQVSGNTFTVSNGTISGTVGSSGVAVVYNATASPMVSVTPGSKNYNTDTLTVTLSLSNATSGSYSVDGGAYQTFTGTKTITIGSGKAYGTVTTLKVKATDGKTTSAEATYTYTKVDPSKTQKAYFDNSSYKWSAVYAYIYNSDTDSYTSWPGTKMQLDSATGYYVIEIPAGYENGKIIFTENENATNNRYPADMEPGLDMNGQTMILVENHVWKPYSEPTTQPTTVQSTTAPATTVPSTTKPVATDRVMIGDANLNGKVTITDATVIQMHVAEMIVLTGNAAVAADVNEDGVISIKDVTEIQRYLAQYGTTTRIGQYVGGEDPTQPTQPTQPSGGNTVTLSAAAVTTGEEVWYAWTWDADADGSWVYGGKGSTVTFTGIKGNVVFARVNPDKGEPNWEDKESVWNQTQDLVTQPGGTYTITDWGSEKMVGSWSGGGENPTQPTSQPTTQPSTQPSGDTVTLSAAAVTTGEEVWYAWTWNTKDDGVWVRGGTGSTVTFTGLKGNVVFARINPGKGEPNWDDKESVWNQTEDLVTQAGGTYTITAWGSDKMVGSWSGGGSVTPTQPSTQPSGGDTVTLSAAKVTTGDEVWYAWTWDTGSEGSWVYGGKGSTVTFTGLKGNVVFARINPSKGEPNWDDKESVWNQTEDLVTKQGGTYTITGWGSGKMEGSWN